MSEPTQTFELPSRDGRACLRGQIDRPHADGASRFAAVLIVNGGWFMERDGFMGTASGTDRDLVYRDLAGGLIAAGIAVIRYDNRGVKGNERTMPAAPAGCSELETARHYLHACIDADARQAVSVRTQMDDVEQVWEFALQHPQVDPQRLIVWAHSEGGLNVGRLVSAGRMTPLGIITVGTAASSPAALVRWTLVDRHAAHLMGWDDDTDGRVTQDDIDRRYPGDMLFPAVGISQASLTAPVDGWTQASAFDHFEKAYAAARSAALAKPDDAPYPDPEPEFHMVAASNHWWRQWFEDSQPQIDHFARFGGQVIIHLGGIDSQFSGPREKAFAEGRIDSGAFVRPPRLIYHPARGHSLRTGEPASGPMDDAARTQIVEEVREILRGHPL